MDDHQLLALSKPSDNGFENRMIESIIITSEMNDVRNFRTLRPLGKSLDSVKYFKRLKSRRKICLSCFYQKTMRTMLDPVTSIALNFRMHTCMTYTQCYQRSGTLLKGSGALATRVWNNANKIRCTHFSL